MKSILEYLESFEIEPDSEVGRIKSRLEELYREKEQIESEMSKLTPLKGSIVERWVLNKVRKRYGFGQPCPSSHYYYLNWYENGKWHSRYIPKQDLPKYLKMKEDREKMKRLKKRLKAIEKEIRVLERKLEKMI